MANTIGTIASTGGASRSICMKVGVTAADVAAPSLATDGVINFPDETVYGTDTGANYAREASIASMLSVFSTAGTGALSITYTLWGFIAAANAGAGVWIPIVDQSGTTPTFTAGVTALKANTVAVTNRYWNIGGYDRLALQVSAVAGTTPVFEAWLNTTRQVA